MAAKVRLVKAMWAEGLRPFVVYEAGDTTTIGTIAQKLCVTPQAVVDDICCIRANTGVLRNLWNNNALPYLRHLEIDRRANLDRYLHPLDPGPAGQASVPLYNVLEGIRLAIQLGSQPHEWLLNDPIIYFSVRKDTMEWQMCQTGGSVAEHQPEMVEKYREAVKKILPYVEKMEGFIREYQEAAQQWLQSASGGKSGLEAMGMLNVLSRIMDVYAIQDPKVNSVNARVKELAAHGLPKFREAFLDTVDGVLKKMVSLSHNRAFNDALFEFLCLSDRADHYYWHTLVAGSIHGAIRKEDTHGFDERVDKAISQFAECLRADEDDAESLGRGASVVIAGMYNEIDALLKEGKPILSPSRKEILRLAQQRYSEFMKTETPNILTTVAVVSVYISIAVGNVEGPPTVLGLILLAYSRTQSFLTALKTDTLLKSALLIGVAPKDWEAIENLVNLGGEHLEDARRLFVKSNWRTTAPFVFYGLFAIGVLAIHCYQVSETDRSQWDQELTKQILVIATDVANAGLVGLTFSYAEDMRLFLKANTAFEAKAITQQVARFERMGLSPAVALRAVCIRVLHSGMAVIGLVLGGWDLADNWRDADEREKGILVLTVVSSLAYLVGAIVAYTPLIAAGFVAGILLALTGWILSFVQSGVRATVRSFLKAFGDTQFFRDSKHVRLEGWVFVPWIGPHEREYGDLFDETVEAVQAFDWGKPRKEHVIHYYRAGLTVDTLALLYEDEVFEIGALLQHQQFLEPTDIVPLEQRVEVYQPELGVPFYVGQLTALEIVRYGWPFEATMVLDPAGAECWNKNPDAYLGRGSAGRDSNNSYDPNRNLVLLERAVWQKESYRQVYRGRLKFLDVPRGGVAQFQVRAAKGGTWNLAFSVERISD